MTVLLVVALAFAPGVFWLWYFYKKDEWEPEPKRLVVRTFLLGLASALPAVMFEMPFRSSGVILAVIAAPLIEEYMKFLAVRLTVYDNPEFNEPMDGITYAAAAALGFASIENVGYLWATDAKFLREDLAFVFIIRAVFSVPGHALFSSIWGYALGLKKCSTQKKSRDIVIRAFFVAAGLHGLFNLAASFSVIGAVGVVVVTKLGWKLVQRKIDAALNDSPFAPARHGNRQVALVPQEEENSPARASKGGTDSENSRRPPDTKGV